LLTHQLALVTKTKTGASHQSQNWLRLPKAK